MSLDHIYYIYPQYHTVSFSLVAKKHIEYINKLNVKVFEVDEPAVTWFKPVNPAPTILHPYFYSMSKVIEARKVLSPDLLEKSLEFWKNGFQKVVGVDVCDSDKISDLAVILTKYADLMIVPSNYCVDVFKASGVKTKIARIPHGVDPEWYTTEKTISFDTKHSTSKTIHKKNRREKEVSTLLALAQRVAQGLRPSLRVL